MVKKFILIVLIVLTIIVIGCKPGEISGNILDQVDNESMNDQSNAEGSDIENGTAATKTLPEGQCLPQWKCVSSSFKSFQSENCSFGEKIECKLGCEDGKCRPAPTCDRKFACKNSRDKGLQIEDCSWVGEVRCEWGCSNATCNLEPPQSNITVVEETEEVIVPKATVYSVKQGEEISVSARGTNHNISIYIIETGRAKLKVDSFKSDWLMDGGNATFSSGITIFIKEILFQAYESGQRSVGFTVE